MTERTIFLNALEQPSIEARAAYLDEACRSDSTLRSRVEDLLALHEQSDGFLAEPLMAAIHSPSAAVEPGADSEPCVDRRARAEDNSEGVIDLSFLARSESPGSLGQIGAYEVTEVVGRGGMGIVLKARDVSLNRVVAIKVLAPELSRNPTAHKRFLREARSAAAVVHQHVVTIHAVHDGGTTDAIVTSPNSEFSGGLPYLVMEYVDGQSLQEKIDREGTLTLREVLRIGAQLASGLAAAHAQGLIHRDIKPANILLENGVERVRITDFGLARAVDDVEVTKTGDVFGTPQYMSPEQARGDAADARTDLFSLGCVLYAMCAGRSPFRAETTIASIRRVCDDTPRSIREVNPETPNWLCAIIERLLAKRPEDRLQTADEVAHLLTRHLANVQDPGSTSFPTVVPAGKVGFWRKDRLSPRWAAAAMALCVVLISLGVTEATGVTRLTPTIVRVVTGEAMLVVEVDDPDVSVQVDGETLVITGAGVHEVRVTPGAHAVAAVKDGEPLRSQVVSVARGGREIVSITRDTRAGILTPGPVGEIRRWEGHPYELFSLAFSPDGRQALVGDAWPIVDGRLFSEGSGFGIRLLDVETGRVLLHVQGESKPIRGIAFTPDGRHALSAGALVRRWDLASGEELPQPRVQLPSGIRAAAFSDDARRVLIAGYDRKLRFWDLDTGQLLGTFSGHTDEINCLALSPDGRRVVAGCGGHHVNRQYVLPSGNTLRVWEVESGAELHCFGDFAKPIMGIAISTDGGLLLSGGGEMDDLAVRLWDLETGELLRVFEGHTDAVSSVCFSPDGRRILTGAGDEPTRIGDGTIRLWDAETGAELRRFYAHRGGVRTVIFSPDGRCALSVGIVDGTVKLWRLPPVETAND